MRFAAKTASGLKSGGILVADSYGFANPGKNDLVVKGNVGIGTPYPQAKLDVFGLARAQLLHLSGHKPTMEFHGDAFSGNHKWKVHLGSNGPGNLEFYADDNPVPLMSLQSHGRGALHLWGHKPTMEFHGDAFSGYHKWMVHLGSNGQGNLEFYLDDQPVPMMALQPTGNVGIGTPNPQAKLDVIGQTRTHSLQITGGADFAENFDVNVGTTTSETPMKVEPGLVVSIDPAHPGKLALSTQAYDRRVAGIISGAGGVKPGMMMGQTGTLADGQYPVALSGSVYCYVDASQGAIEPGDLLTTSAMPGHAMKVTDSAKAQGAIIGKAMTGLKEGKGLVLVLVTLQ